LSDTLFLPINYEAPTMRADPVSFVFQGIDHIVGVTVPSSDDADTLGNLLVGIGLFGDRTGKNLSAEGPPLDGSADLEIPNALLKSMQGTQRHVLGEGMLHVLVSGEFPHTIAVGESDPLALSEAAPVIKMPGCKYIFNTQHSSLVELSFTIDLPREVEDVLDEVLREHTTFRWHPSLEALMQTAGKEKQSSDKTNTTCNNGDEDEDGGGEFLAMPKGSAAYRASQRVTATIKHSSQHISHGLRQIAGRVGDTFMYTSKKAATYVPESMRTSLEVPLSITYYFKGMRLVSGFYVQVLALPVTVATKAAKGATWVAMEVLPTSLMSSSTPEHPTLWHGVKEVTVASFKGAGNLIGAVDDAADVMVTNARDAAVHPVEHTLGEDMGGITRDTAQFGINMGKVTVKVTKMVMAPETIVPGVAKGMVKGAVKGGAKEAVTHHAKKENKLVAGNDAAEASSSSYATKEDADKGIDTDNVPPLFSLPELPSFLQKDKDRARPEDAAFQST
jgi:hypothetical protein